MYLQTLSTLDTAVADSFTYVLLVLFASSIILHALLRGDYLDADLKQLQYAAVRLLVCVVQPLFSYVHKAIALLLTV
jgi:hypothetical protein